MRSHNVLTRFTAVAASGLLLAACGSSPGHSASRAANQNPATAAYAFSRCMRSHGVSKFPDPHVVMHGNAVSVMQALPQGAAASPAFKSAMKACAYLQPGPQSAHSDGHRPSKAVLLAFARCLRAHGVTGFPDPNGQGQLTLAMIQAAGVNVHTQVFFTRARSCVGVTHGMITVAEIAALTSGSH